MMDSSFKDFAVVAAALVVSPGATMAVVTEVALRRGRFAALVTVAGVNIANSSLALASALGLSAVLHRWPSLLQAVSVGGALYLMYLGLRALWHTMQVDSSDSQNRFPSASVGQQAAIVRGMLTNFLNPSVILFYMLLLPQFIRSTDPFFRRFLLLAATHVSMSLLWLSAYAIAVGTLSERMSRPWARRALGFLTGAVLAILGVKLLLQSRLFVQ